MTVVASKPTYQVGDTARLVAQANLAIADDAVAIERDGIIDAKVVKLANPSEGIELPIIDAWAPNVFASIAMVSGRTARATSIGRGSRWASSSSRSRPTHKQLDVAVKLDADHVRPGDPVTGKIIVTQQRPAGESRGLALGRRRRRAAADRVRDAEPDEDVLRAVRPRRRCCDELEPRRAARRSERRRSRSRRRSQVARRRPARPLRSSSRRRTGRRRSSPTSTARSRFTSRHPTTSPRSA